MSSEETINDGPYTVKGNRIWLGRGKLWKLDYEGDAKRWAMALNQACVLGRKQADAELAKYIESITNIFMLCGLPVREDTDKSEAMALEAGPKPSDVVRKFIESKDAELAKVRGEREKLFEIARDTHYLCERCGGTGRSEQAPFKGEPNLPGNVCGLCGGVGVLGKKIDVAALRERCGALEGIVERLPKTADGKPIAPGMLMYLPEQLDDPHMVTGITNFKACGADDPCEQAFFTAADDDYIPHDSAAYYSTPEAAQAALRPPDANYQPPINPAIVDRSDAKPSTLLNDMRDIVGSGYSDAYLKQLGDAEPGGEVG